jgi:polysaccharide chain length determinant protein (PEP-CTERM system associated)
LRDQLLSRTYLQQVMDRYGLFGGGSSWEERTTQMRSRIDLAVSRTDAFRISFTYTDPAVARDVTNALAGLVIGDSTQAAARQSQGTAAMLQQQLSDVSTSLSAKERELADFKALHMGALPDQIASTLSALDAAKSQLSTARGDLAAARDRRSRLEALVARPGAEATPVTVRQLALDILATTGETDLDRKLASQPPIVRLEALRMHRDSLLQRLTDRHPDVQAIEREIATLEAQGAGSMGLEATSTVPLASGDLTTAGLDEAQREVRSHEQRRAEIEGQIAELEVRLASAPGVEKEFLELARERDSLQRAYDDIRGRTMEASLAGGVDIERNAGFKVVDPAVTPQRKSGPSRALFLLGGGIFGLVLALAGGTAHEMVLQPLHGPNELERHVGIPVLGAIPSIDNPKRRARRRRLRAVGAMLIIAAVASVFLLQMMGQG